MIALLILVVLPLVSIGLVFIDYENPKTKKVKARVGMMNMNIKDNSIFNFVFIARRIVIVVLALYLANYPGIQV